MSDERERPVNPVWKWIAMVTMGILIGGAPGYVNLLLHQANQLNLANVDKEITVQNAAQIREITRLEDKVDGLTGEVQELNKLEEGDRKRH